MKPDWDKLATEYADSSVVVIGDVDCTVHQDLCGEHGVKGYPTIKVFMGGEPDDYKGGRSLKDLKKYTEDNLMEAACDSNHKDSCSPEQLKELEAAMAMPEEERTTKLAEIKAEIKATEKKHEDLLETLQAQYKESMESTETKVAELKKSTKWLKAVKKPAEKKDEL
jgi:thioredoxin-like negative regulator of GroEL